VFNLDKPSSLVYCLWARPGDYPIVEHLKGVLLGLAPPLPENIILSWKGLQGQTHKLITKIHNLQP